MREKTKPVYKSIRKVWGFNPKTRVKSNDKGYDRNLTKKQLRDVIEKEDF